MDELRLAVVGAGLMGHSIAGVFAGAGAAVAVFDPDPSALEALPGRLRASGLADHVRPAGDLRDAVTGADVVIEAATENLELKQRLFAQLSDWLPDVVLATNTSSYRIGEVAARATRPERVVGMHWFNPPHLVPLVEVTSGEATSQETVDTAMALLRRAGKTPVHVRKDIPGFIGNRLQHAMWREALALIDEGVCDAETVDLVVRQSFALRLAAMGPVENADYVGLDLVLAVHEYLFPSLTNTGEPSSTLRELVAKGELGAKTGSGFLQWDDERRAEAAARLAAHLGRMAG